MVSAFTLSTPVPSATSRPCWTPLRRPPMARVAIIGTVPSTLPDALLAPDTVLSSISVSVASLQHQAYSHILATAPSITHLLQSPATPHLPDSIFVEDPAILLSPATAAFLPESGHPARAGEGTSLEPVLAAAGLRAIRAAVRLDGGDVLRLPAHILIGLSARSEPAAVPRLRDAFTEAFRADTVREPVPHIAAVEVRGGLHLKSLVTWVGGVTPDDEGFLVAPDCEPGRALVQAIADVTSLTWDVAWVPEREKLAANVLFIPGEACEEGGTAKAARVVMQASCPAAMDVVRRKLKGMQSPLCEAELLGVDMRELAKANGAPTCMSIIL